MTFEHLKHLLDRKRLIIKHCHALPVYWFVIINKQLYLDVLCASYINSFILAIHYFLIR